MSKSIKEQYISLQEGSLSKANFMRNLRMSLPQYVTNTTSFNDSIRILKNKGILTESDIKEMVGQMVAGDPEEEAEMRDMLIKKYNMNPEQLKRGVEVEMEHTSDPKVAEQIAMDHLREDPEYYTKLDSVGLEEANPGIDPTWEEDPQRLESSKSIYTVVSKDDETAILEDKEGNLYAFQYSDKKSEIQPYESGYGDLDDEAIENYVNDNDYALSKGVGMADWEGDKDIVKIDDSLSDNFSSLLDTINENNEEELSPNMKHIQKSMGDMGKPEITPERRAELEKQIKAQREKEQLKENQLIISGTDKAIKMLKAELKNNKVTFEITDGNKVKVDDSPKTRMAIKMVKERVGMQSIKLSENKKSLKENKNFQEIDTINSQELLIGIDCEMQKNISLTKTEAAKIAIKKIKKIPNYYTMAYLSGEEGSEPKYLGGKSAEPEAHQMKPYSADKVIDKKMGMQPVKGINKAKSSANKAHKETNTVVKGVEELTFIAKKAQGIKQRFDPTGSTMKVVRESINKILAKERLKEAIRKELKNIKK